MKTLIVGIIDPKHKKRDLEILEETKSLCLAEGLNPEKIIVQTRAKMDPKSVVGKGKLDQIAQICEREGFELVVFDHPLKPGQWKEITSRIPVKVIDKYMLILDIFARRAQSAEGKLKVELAQLEYNLPKLTELDSGLSRLVGGIGGRGPGETKLEISRRRSRERIKILTDKLRLLEKRRSLLGKPPKGFYPIVTLVGYTNVGKSSLFNAILGRKDAEVKNKLFATLDPKRRLVSGSLDGKNYHSFMLVDTVGFIRDLPPQLYETFKSTIMEIAESDLVLVVVDASDTSARDKFEKVLNILKDIGVSEDKILVVINKIDIGIPEVYESFSDFPNICVSALKRRHIFELKKMILSSLYPESLSASCHQGK